MSQKIRANEGLATTILNQEKRIKIYGDGFLWLGINQLRDRSTEPLRNCDRFLIENWLILLTLSLSW
ncbi:hypothetical protein NWP17_11710 [Chrysosporum bergii ANA360D]|uniref:Uncharacterized protein n=1 Tax=Chrysosporum bergii ANA360D TaxID=617107 RepID=A0AA43GTJ6_9CYAN|nr:hypothetical protein [Chrysosporum bergii]MDH6061096.1 hypothetical protein [Chrysosporum bergii ANA360D]